MKSKEILVSISCITYNHASYIRQCLDGFMMQQTDFAFEVLIHDDCSTDGTTEIIREYEEKYPQVIKPMYETENQYSQGKPIGTSVWNLPRAKGKYIAICEGDDYWTDPLKLQKQVDFLEAHPDVGLCYTDCDKYYEKENKWDKMIFASGMQHIDPANPIVSDGYFSNLTWIYRKSMYPVVPTLPFTVYDGALNLFYSFCIQSSVAYVPGPPTGVYRRHEGSASCFTVTQKQKQLAYLISNLKLRLYYADYFTNPEKAKTTLFSNGLRELLPLALEMNNEEIIQLFRNFFADKVDMDVIEFIAVDRLKARNSSSYKIGSKIVNIIKKIRSIFGC